MAPVGSILMWWNPFVIFTVTKSSLGSNCWATVLIASHLNVSLKQLSSTTLTGVRFCIKQNLLFCFGTMAMWGTQCGLSTSPANTRHWPNACPMLANCGVGKNYIKPALVQCLIFAGMRSIACWSGSGYCWLRVQADTDPMSVKWWGRVASAGRYPFSPSQYFMLAGLRAHSIHRPNGV